MSHIPPNVHSHGSKKREIFESYDDHFCYVDTPDFKYDEWLARTSDAHGCVGRACGKVLVIGGGVSGCTAAAELSKAGCSVTLVESEWEIGGRCDSTKFEGDKSNHPNLVELGAMRFSESQWCFSYYLDKFGIAPGGVSSLPIFPDPGKVTTWLCTRAQDKERSVLWTSEDEAAEIPPRGFETVYSGWNALANDGPTLKDGPRGWFKSPRELQELLKRSASDPNALHEVKTAWQRYIDAFGGKSFYTVVYEIFTGTGSFAIPNDVPWTFEDFEKFGTMGVGSGGFSSLYSINFPEIFRLIVDGLEDEQRFLRKGVRSLPLALLEEAAAATGKIRVVLGTRINNINGTKDSGFAVEYSGRRTLDLENQTFHRVVLATTTRSMELTTNVTSNQELLDPKVSTAVQRTHVVSSAKVGLRIRKFWDDQGDSSAPQNARCLLSDNIVRQIYTLDYGADDGSAVCFLTYVWDDDAVKQQGLGASKANAGVDKVKLYKELFAKLRTYAKDNDDLARWIKNITPFVPNSGNTGDIVNSIEYVEWQSKPAFNGAFKLSQPGQDAYVQAMYFDFQKASDSKKDTGLYIAGDCIAYTSGWVEGAIQTGLNATAAVITSLHGTLHADPRGHTPMTIDKSCFNYFPTAKSKISPPNLASARRRRGQKRHLETKCNTNDRDET